MELFGTRTEGPRRNRPSELTVLDDLNIPDPAEVPERRRPFFEALRLLRDGDTQAALKRFRRASRKAEPPFDALSALGAAECQHALGKSGAALATLRRITAESAYPAGILIGAWRKIATIEEARDNQAAVDDALNALADLDDNFVP